MSSLSMADLDFDPAWWYAQVHPHRYGLLGGSLLAIFFNAMARAHPDTRRTVKGIPIYIYAVAMIFQVVVFLPTAYCAWQRWAWNPEWMKEGWTTSPGWTKISPMHERKRYERLYLYALWGYMIKDMWIFRRDFLFFAHHLVCLFGILAFFAVPAGVGASSAGATVLELGNFTFNLALLAGKDSSPDVPREIKHAFEYLYHVCMPLSNAIGAAMFAWFSQFPKLKGTVWVYCLGVAWFSLIAGREAVHLRRSVPYFRAERRRKADLARRNEEAKKIKKKL